MLGRLPRNTDRRRTAPAGLDCRSGDTMMLRTRSPILPRLFSSSSSSSPPSIRWPLHRLLSAAATANPSSTAAVVEAYLVANCGLSEAEAVHAAKRVAHLNPPSRPDAVLAFLAGLGLSRAAVAAAVASDPVWLYADAARTLAPRAAELEHQLGLSRADVARLATVVSHAHFRSASLRRNLEFWVPVFGGSVDALLRALTTNPGLFDADLDHVAKPNLTLLRDRGILVSSSSVDFIARVLTKATAHLQAAFALTDEFGLDPTTTTAFRHAVATFASINPDKLTTNIHLLHDLGWSRDDIAVSLRKAPRIMGLTEGRIRANVEFLVGDVGLDVPYVARRPVLMLYSVERRLLPRHCLINFLKAKGLLPAELGFYYFANMAKERFVKEVIQRYEESVPGLAAAYASSCAGDHHLWDEQLTQSAANEEGNSGC